MKTALLTLLVLASTSAHAGGSIGASIRDLDEGTRASVVKELSKIHRYEDGRKGHDNSPRQSGQTSDSCDMNVASTTSTPSHMPTPRKAITVVTGNIVQICNR
jgi:hypothetical protein